MSKRVLALVLAALFPGAALAQTSLVKDIAPGFARPDWPYHTKWVSLGGIAVFTTYDSVHGMELWRSDGTAAGTHPILDICPGICSSDPMRLTVVGSTVFFGADDGIHGRSLWKTDGTAAGTTLIREEVDPLVPAALGNLLVFSGMSPEGGQELWRSDGTRAGTFAIDLWPGANGSYPWPLGYVGSSLLFSASDPVHGRGLWKTDGTAANTSFIVEAPTLWGTAYGPQIYPSLGGRLFYPSGDGFLWVSDGTPAGTHKVSDVPIDSGDAGATAPIALLGDEIYFSGSDASGYEFWKSDGTAQGTMRVKDVKPGADSSYPAELTVAGDLLFFRVLAPASSPNLWRSDGTADGTLPVEPGPALDFEDGFNSFQAVGGKLAFFAISDGKGQEPWVSDRTGAGTVLLADIYPGPSSSYGSSDFPPSRVDAGAILEGEWLFRAQTPDGWAIWKSDGTPAGTGLVEAIHDGAGAWGVSPSFDPAAPSLADLDGTLILAANEDGGQMELWRSDGSGPGTSPIGDPSLFQRTPSDLTRLGDHVYFTTVSKLWRTDGATAEIPPFAPSGSYLVDLALAGPYLFYRADGGRLERTDGTTSTQILDTGGTSIGPLTAAGPNLFFNRWDNGGEELWKSGGAAGDAVKIEIFPGPGSAQPRSIAAFGSSVFLGADDGSTGRELWFSDGTAAGTRRVKDIVPGPGSSNPRSIVKAGNLVFFIADDGIAGAELWRSDGTAAGTFLVEDIRTGPESSWIQGLTAHGGRVLFAADDGASGQELWSSDGTAAGTYLVSEIRPGAGSSSPQAFRVLGHVVLFAADDGTHGLELWRTDGTAPGTFLLHDVNPGPEPSSPAGFTLSGDHVFFTANDGTHGFELWALDRDGLGAFLSARKKVTGPALPGGIVTFEIVITNEGIGQQPDNPGDEMVDILQAPLALLGASSDVGTVTLDLVYDRVYWNGVLEPGDSATVTIQAAIPPSTEFQTFANQALVVFDRDGDGTSETGQLSDDPGQPGTQATQVRVSSLPLDFHTVPPCRVVDTRSATPLASEFPRTFPVSGTCGIPPMARAVAANLTAVGSTGQGRIVVYPYGITPPATSSVNFAAAEARGSSTMLSLIQGHVDAMATVSNGGTVHLILDVTGYYE